MTILGITELVPDLVCEVLVEQRALLTWLELWLRNQVGCTLEMRAGDDLDLLLIRLLLGRLSLLLRAGWFFLEGHCCGLHLLCGSLVADLSDLGGHTRALEGLGRRATTALLGAGAHHAAVLGGCEAGEVRLDVASISEGIHHSGTF